MLGAGRDQVDSGRREARVAEDVGEFDDVVGLVVESLGEKVAEVVGKDFPGWTPACLQSAFISAQICFRLMGLPLLVRKISPEAIFCFRAYFKSFRQSLPGSKIVRIFPFRAIFSAAKAGGFDGKVFHFADSDTGGADRFEEEGQTFFIETFGGVDQAVEFVAGEFPGVVPESAALEFQGTGAAVGPAGEGEKGIQGGQFAVDSAGTKTFSQGLLPLVDGFGGHFPIAQARNKMCGCRACIFRW